ncbi:MAG: T9SS type A sorting domain-containing protein [Ignavibacteria bacterium]
MNTDNGVSWIQKNEGMGRQQINSLYTTADYIYAGTQGSSVWRRPLTDIISVNKQGISVPETYSLSQNYPNPFNPSTTIDYQLPISGFVKISVFDVLGQEVKTLVNEYKQAGTYNVRFDASELPSGVYFYKITSGDFTGTKKLTLIK